MLSKERPGVQPQGVRDATGADLRSQHRTHLFALVLTASSEAPARRDEGGSQRPLPEELGTGGSDFDQAAGQAFSLHHRGHGRQAVPLHQAAGDPRGGGALPGRDDDAESVVSAAPHGAPAGVHHETDQEAERHSGG